MPGKLSGKVNVKELAMKYWWAVALVLIVSSAFWIRSFPARFGELQALDPFFFYRTGEYALQNGLSVNYHDALRYFPDGVNTYQIEYMLPIYLPVFGYLLVSALGSQMTFLQFSIIFPAILGAISVLVMYFLGRELFQSRLAGISSAFFMAVIPAAVTRTSAGFLEKEPVAAIFIPLTAYFFVRAFRRKSLIDGIMSGISLAMLGMSWGGVQYIYALYVGFFGVLFLTGGILVLLNYLFGGLDKWVSSIESCYDERIIFSFLPLVLIGIPLHWVFPHNITTNAVAVQLSFAVAGVLAVRYGVERFKLIKSELLPYVIPGIMVIGVVGLLTGSMFIDSLARDVSEFTGLMTFEKGVIGTTVAENAPGDWAAIQSTTGNSYSSAYLPQLSSVSWFFSASLLMILGIGAILYRVWKRKDWILILPAIWFFTSIFAVFYYVRLVFLIAVPASLLSGFFAYWVVDKSKRTGAYKRMADAGKRFNPIAIILVALAILLVMTNFASAYAYGINLGPSICFPRYNSNDPFDVEPCITYDENGNEVFADNQPWYEAFAFFRDQTPEDSVILSWWDFGHWFHARAERASVADGGNLFGSTINVPIAQWYVDDVSNWDDHEEWIKSKGVTHILMDYTLPGKYGAISKIASDGEQIIGYLQMNQAGTQQRENDTIYVFSNGPYEIWLPMGPDGGLSGTPMFLISQNGQYYQRSYINEVCTNQGILTVGNQTPSMPGCVGLADFGVFYVPPEAENSIFNSLMFMEGKGLPVKKVFDNRYVKIYEVEYGE